MTEKMSTIFSAYTGISFGSFSEMHGYIEKILGRPVWTHEMADKALWAEIKEKAKPDFLEALKRLSAIEAGCQHYNIGPKGCPDCDWKPSSPEAKEET